LPDPFLFLGIWLIGGLYALCGASSLAELGAAIPRSGGQYNFSRRALGDYAGFVVGWSDWLSCCGTMAAVAIVIGEYLAKLIPAIAGWEKMIAVATIIGFAILQWRGVRWGSSAQLVTSVLKTGAFIVLILACFMLGSRAHEAAIAVASPSMPTGWSLVVAIMLSLQAVLYTIDGWNGVIYFGEEVQDLGRSVPRAIFGSVFSIVAIYLFLNAAALYVLPISAIAGNTFALGSAAQLVFGEYGDTIIRSTMVVSLLSCINAVQLFCSRILYAMAADGLFIKQASRVNAGGTPVLALWLSTLAGVLFVMGSFERVIAMLSFFFVANYTLSYVSLFILRKKEPGLPRPYRAWGYPWTTGIALAGSILFLVGSIITDQQNAPYAVVLLALSYPVFRIIRRKNA
jgi:APA family basic amino acid/polyamine antiporter